MDMNQQQNRITITRKELVLAISILFSLLAVRYVTNHETAAHEQKSHKLSSYNDSTKYARLLPW